MNKKWDDRSIVYLAASRLEWSPDSLKTTGIGGSETAVIHLARQWAKAGYSVTVYAPCKGIYDGVEYLPYSEFNPEDHFSTLICWRYNHKILSRPIRAKRKWIDLHELHLAEDLSMQAFEEADKIFVKSRFQKNYYRKMGIAEEKFRVIPNGIAIPPDLSLQKPDFPRIVYCSSYDRGLAPLLAYAWPVIKKELPDAQLHIYYGWETFPDSHAFRKLKWKINFLMMQEGVFHHGRIPQPQLLEEKAKSHFHYHIATVEEVDSISVRESFALQCLPLLSHLGALQELPFGIHFPENPLDQKTHMTAAKKLIELWRRPAERQKHFSALSPPGWQEIAAEWMKELE